MKYLVIFYFSFILGTLWELPPRKSLLVLISDRK